MIRAALLLGLLLAQEPAALPLSAAHPFASAKITYRTPGGEGVAWIQGTQAVFRRSEKRGAAPLEERWTWSDGREIRTLHKIDGKIELATVRPHPGRDLGPLLAGWTPERRATALARVPAVWRRYSPVFGHAFLGSPVDFLGGRSDRWAGKDCEVFRYSTNSNWTAWFWKGSDVILKLEDSGLVPYEATKVELGLPVPAGTFDPPAGVEFKPDEELGRRELDAVTEFLGRAAGGTATADCGDRKYALTELYASVEDREDGAVLTVETEDCPWHLKLRIRLPGTLAESVGKQVTRPRADGEDEAELNAWDDVRYEAEQVSVKVVKAGAAEVELVLGGAWKRVTGAGRKQEREAAAVSVRLKVPFRP